MAKVTVYQCDRDGCTNESSNPIEVPGWIGLEVKDGYYASDESGWIHITAGDKDFCSYRCFIEWADQNLH
jgi:hypothetical protein